MYHIYRRIYFILAIFFVIIITCLYFQFNKVSEAQASVGVSRFWASTLSGENQITLSWCTETERNNLGFYISKSTQLETDDTVIISEIITDSFQDSMGSPFEGMSCDTPYTYIDNDVSLNAKFYYTLVSVGVDEVKAIEAQADGVAGDPYTPTPTRTRPPTRTPTPTPTLTSISNLSEASTDTPTSTSQSSNDSPTARPTKTPKTSNSSNSQPTITPYFSGQAYPTATPLTGQNNPPSPITPDISGNGTTTVQPAVDSGEATATLIPLPTITFEIPGSTPSVTAGTVVAGQNSSNGSKPRTWFTGPRLVIIGIIAGVWLLLGGWLFFSLRRMH